MLNHTLALKFLFRSDSFVFYWSKHGADQWNLTSCLEEGSPRDTYPLQGVCVCVCVCVHVCARVHARSVVADSLLTHWPAMLLCPRGFAGENTRVGCQFLLQGNFLTQELNPCLLPLSPALAGKFFNHLSHRGSSTLFRDHLKLLSPDSECRHTLSNPVSQQNVLVLSCLTGGKSYLVKFNFIEVI